MICQHFSLSSKLVSMGVNMRILFSSNDKYNMPHSMAIIFLKEQIEEDKNSEKAECVLKNPE